MKESISTTSFVETASAVPLKALKTIVIGGLTVGVLDCLAATINAGLRGVTFAQVWQFVASGLLGENSYSYGWTSVLLGLLIHFFIAFSVTTVFYLASLPLPILFRQAVSFGILYGIAVYFVMSYAVMSLSAVSQSPFTVRGLITGLLIHIVCVGLPIAFITRWFARNG